MLTRTCLMTKSTFFRAMKGMKRVEVPSSTLSMHGIAARSISLNIFEKQNVGVIEGKTITPTNRDLINSSYGLQQFINQTYAYTGGSVIGSLTLASVFATTILPSHPIMTVLGGVVFSFGGMIGMFNSPYSIEKDTLVDESHEKDSVVMYTSINSTNRLIAFGTFVTGMSMAISPLFVVYPDAIFPSIIASSMVFGGAGLYAYSRPVGEISLWGPAIAAGLGGLVGVSLVGMGSDLIFGVTSFSKALYNVNLYAGIPLFTLMIAHDTNKAIELYEARIPDHLGCSAQLYLDFVNLFSRFVEIIGRMQGGSRD